MRITSFHIDGFGLFSNVDVPEVPPGLSIFFGHNEAGKSTCLEFLRVMLTGYPESRKREARQRLNPINGGQAGGSLSLEYSTTLGETEKLLLTRRPGGPQELALFRPDGAPVSEDVLKQILGGVNQEVYRKVFGFSLGELERFETLNDAGVRNALYGASFGPGLTSPADALKILQKQMEEIFRPSGSRSALNKTLAELEELREELADAQATAAAYDELCAELSQKTDQLHALRQTKKELESERRGLERRLAVWQQWAEWRKLGLQLAELPPAVPDFPENAIDRFARIDENRQICEQQVTAWRQKLDARKQRLDALVVNAPLLAELPFLRRLGERKSGYLQAIAHIGAYRESLERSKAELGNFLAQLGPDWTCERIRATDRSLFAREDLEKKARAMTAANLASQAARDYLARANKDVEHATAEVETARRALDAIPEPVAELSEQDRDELRRNMERLEEFRRQAPRRQETLRNAQMAFSRAIKQLNIVDSITLEKISADTPDAASSAEASAAVDGLLESQVQAKELAAEIKSLLSESADMTARQRRQAGEESTLRKAIDERVAERRKSGGATRELLEQRSKALRELRSAKSQLDSMQERIDEMDQRMASDPAPRRRRNWALLSLGSIFVLCGAALFCAAQFMGLHELALTAQFTLPVSLPYAYAAVVLGVVLFALGWPGNSEEMKRHQTQMKQLSASRESAAMRLAEAGERVSQLCKDAGISSADPVTLDATEVRLEREKERCINDERSLREIESLKSQLSVCHDRLASLSVQAQDIETKVQAARRRWHKLMESLNVQVVPSPESVDTIFAQLNGARTAWENVIAARKELDALWEDLHLVEEWITGLPAIASRLKTSTATLSMEEAVRDTLDSCKEAEQVRARRSQASAALDRAEEGLMRAQTRQDEAAMQLAESAKNVEAEGSAWEQGVASLGLGSQLDPETVREAFTVMASCLASEDRMENARRDLANCENELAAFQDPLISALARLNESPISGADDQPDWVHTLDSLMERAEANAQVQSERQRLQAMQADDEDELHAREAALESARKSEQELFAIGGADNAESFLKLAREHAERLELSGQQQNLEAALKNAAGDVPLSGFLDSFSSLDQASQESRLGEIQEQLDNLAEREDSLSTEVYAEQARIRDIAQDNKLAALRQRQSELDERVRRLSTAWTAHALARSLLLKAKHKFESERQPEVIRDASAIFAQLTNGKWAGLRTTLDDSRLEILSGHGEPISPEVLSRGAQEQAYLALRLAYIRNHARHASALPVIMDEILVNFDPARSAQAARSFASLAHPDSGEAQQIFYFTCQPYMVELLKAAAPEARLFRVENGNIAAA